MSDTKVSAADNPVDVDPKSPKETAKEEGEAPEPNYGTKPVGAGEFTFRAAFAAMIVAALIGASYPYVVMKLGFGPNISVVSAFFGYLMLGILFKGYNRWENNIVQTAGT